MNYEEIITAIAHLEKLVINECKYAEAVTEAYTLLSEPLLEIYHELHGQILLALCESLQRQGMLDESLLYAQKACELGEVYDLKELTANALSRCATIYKHISDYSTSLEYHHKALNINEELGSKRGVAGNLHNIGNVYWDISDYRIALEYYQKALDINEEIGNISWIANNLGSCGNVYYSLSDYPTSLEYHQKSLAINEKLGNKIGIAINLNACGNVYTSIANYPKALEYYQKALAMNEELNTKPEIAMILGNCGIVYGNLSDYATALMYYQKALLIYQEIGSKDGTARNLTNIGYAYEALLDYTTALEYYQKSLAIYKEIGHQYGTATALSNCAIIYQSFLDYSKVLIYFQKALSIYKKIGSQDEIGRILGNLGGVYSKKDFEGYDIVKAEDYLLQAIRISEEVGKTKNVYSFHRTLSDLYNSEKRWEECLNHFEKYYELEKEVQSEESKKQAEQMEYRRKIEESERDRQVKLARFQEQEKILHNILPSQIAERMVSGEVTIADMHENVSVFFSDIVGFTKLSQQVKAVELVGMLNGIFTQFDQLARKHGLEKIKTIGDAYMAVCGAPTPMENHAERAALFALEVSEMMNEYRTNSGEKIELRIGLHSGNVVAGIIGENKFAYDMWGDAVNTASRMESHGETGKIHVSEDFFRAIQGTCLDDQSMPRLHFIDRGEMDIKGKGMMKTYFLEKE